MRLPKLLMPVFNRRLVAVFVSLILLPFEASAPVFGQDPSEEPKISVPKVATVEQLFVDFLHYARMGQFTVADAHAKALLNHPQLDPVAVMRVAAKERDAVDVIFILIKNSSIGENAVRVLDLITFGEYETRQDSDRIIANIGSLGGSPQQEHFAARRLIESGEYAVPALVAALLDPAKAELRPRIEPVLGMLGKTAVGALVQALAVADNDVRVSLINALGRSGYPQAIPYLRKLTLDPSMPEESKAASLRAIAAIEKFGGRPFYGQPDELFLHLAEKHYDEDSSVGSDPRLSESNVWYWDADTQALVATPVSQMISGPIMAMRCCEEALDIRRDNAGAMSLWLAANIRREARLGLDVESGDAEATGATDPTRPAVFPRALYFGQASGPRYAHLVLQRAVEDNDAAVALGAIRVLRLTAGESSLIGRENYKQPLVRAMRFPDFVVRIRAALALGAALPKTPFADSEFVVPQLADALNVTGQDEILVVDGDRERLNRTMELLRTDGRSVVGETTFLAAMERARSELRGVSAVFVSAGIKDPSLSQALSGLRSQFIFAKTPVVIMADASRIALAETVAANDPATEVIDVFSDASSFDSALGRIRERTGQTPLDSALASSIALEAMEVLRFIAVDGRTVYDFSMAESALIAVLQTRQEDLRKAAAAVLALMATSNAQSSLAELSLDEGNGQSLRAAGFDALSLSAKNHGNLLPSAIVETLIETARGEADLLLRTAASQALGALNLASDEASSIIRSYRE